jgi:thiamine-monophosphate kinase
MELIIPLRNFAQGAIDVSDGLAADVEKLAQASHVGAVIEADKVPLSPAARKALARDPGLLAAMLTGGDDYEIVAAVPETSVKAFETEAKNKTVPVTAFGRLEQGSEIKVIGPDGASLKLAHKGFTHF